MDLLLSSWHSPLEAPLGFQEGLETAEKAFFIRKTAPLDSCQINQGDASETWA